MKRSRLKALVRILTVVVVLAAAGFARTDTASAGFTWDDNAPMTVDGFTWDVVPDGFTWDVVADGFTWDAPAP
jgi:hypothetical protein